VPDRISSQDPGLRVSSRMSSLPSGRRILETVFGRRPSFCKSLSLHLDQHRTKLGAQTWMDHRNGLTSVFRWPSFHSNSDICNQRFLDLGFEIFNWDKVREALGSRASIDLTPPPVVAQHRGALAQPTNHYGTYLSTCIENQI